MFHITNNVIKIAVDEEHSVDELVELIKPCLTSGSTTNGTRRLVYVVDACDSDDAFQLAMSLSKDLRLPIDLLRSSKYSSTMPLMIPEIITMNAAGISYITSSSIIKLPGAIIHHIGKVDDIAAVLVETSLLSDVDLRYLERSFRKLEDKERPMLLAVRGIA